MGRALTKKQRGGEVVVQCWSSYNVAVQKADTVNKVVKELGYIPDELKNAIKTELTVAYKSCVAKFYEHLDPKAISELHK